MILALNQRFHQITIPSYIWPADLSKHKPYYNLIDYLGLKFLKYFDCARLGMQDGHNAFIQHVPNWILCYGTFWGSTLSHLKYIGIRDSNAEIVAISECFTYIYVGATRNLPYPPEIKNHRTSYHHILLILTIFLFLSLSLILHLILTWYLFC